MSTPTHPTPKEARLYSALLRELCGNPQYKFLEPPTPTIRKPDVDNSHVGLLWVADFAEKTYITTVVPLLPAGATRKCRDVANPWAYAAADCTWEWEWSEEKQTLVEVGDREKTVAFPTLPTEQLMQCLQDGITRGVLESKLIVENGEDTKAKMLLGGQAFDFGEEARRLVKEIRSTYA